MSTPSPSVSSTALDPRALIGSWTFTRRLVDRVAGQSGRAAGTLTITAAGDQLRWHEAGQLHWAGRIVAVTRDLELHLLDGAWWVSFADGRPFHPWLVGEPLVHPCAADLYLGRIALDAGGNLLRVAWDVTGPSKAQRIITRHRRRLVLPRADDRPLAIP